MTNVLGTKVTIKNLGEWKEIFDESGFNDINVNTFYDDVFKRSYSIGEFVKIIVKMIFHIIINKKIREKLSPTLKFARKFKKVLGKGEYFGFLIFTGIK